MAVDEVRSGPSPTRPAGADGDRGDEDGARLTGAIAAQLGSRREARWIVEHGGVSGAQALADRRASGEPLQYVLGRWPFRSVEVEVDRRVLIPRPETEQVVEVALGELRRLQRLAACAGVGGDGGDPVTTPVAVDLGTGSGAIALSLATEGDRLAPGLEVWATDVSSDAAEVARSNVARWSAQEGWTRQRVRVVEGPWFSALPAALAGGVDLVVSNPPYVAESEYAGLDATVRDWEPHLALVAGPGAGGVEGMGAIELIIAETPHWLRSPGTLVVEISPTQRRASLDAALRAGFSGVSVEDDLAGRPRVLVARR